MGKKGKRIKCSQCGKGYNKNNEKGLRLHEQRHKGSNEANL